MKEAIRLHFVELRMHEWEKRKDNGELRVMGCLFKNFPYHNEISNEEMS